MSLFLTLALSVLTGLRDALSIGWEWLTAKPSRIIAAVLVGLCAFLCWRLSAIDGDRDRWRTRADGYEAAAKAVADANEKASAIGIVTAAEVRKDIDDANDPFDAIGIFSMGLGMFLAAMTGVTIRYLPPTSSQVCHTRPRVRY